MLIGLTIVGLGIYLLVSGYVSEPDGRLSILAFPCIGITILGIVPVFLAICGCWGALRFNRCCLGLYFTFLLFVFAAEIATGIAGVVYKEKVRDGIMQYLKAAVDAYQPGEGQKLTALDLIQVTFQCCGYESSADYLKKLQSVPQSCCAYGNCVAIGANLSSDLPGCKERAIDIESRTLIICAVIIALALVQLKLFEQQLQKWETVCSPIDFIHLSPGLSKGGTYAVRLLRWCRKGLIQQAKSPGDGQY
ncbi:unnamed protein product [Dibothriocephalus latus]|uniref:Uncharacterized protein n=1 Tax=Dibothriocephalus latus TaxID=60516 RepID=A0A3P7LRF5_DIBLA|nr:unnamed protein product [Dibothriocephalus latus]